MNQEPFSLGARQQSLKYAWAGILAFFKSQHNAIIYLIITLGVIVAALLVRVSLTEAAALVLATGLVWSAELFNTAIEAIMDHLSPAKDPKVKFVKDVSAAGVLLAALTAATTGLIIFIPKIF